MNTKIYHLALAEQAFFRCVSQPVSQLELRKRLQRLNPAVENWDYHQKEGILFISPAPLSELKKLKDIILKFRGKVYIAPNDSESTSVIHLFAGSPVTILYSNIDHFQGDHLDRILDTLICEDIRVKFETCEIHNPQLWQQVTAELLPGFQETGRIIGQKYNAKPVDGSLSMKYKGMVIVTASKTDKTKITEEDLVIVERDNAVIRYIGKRLPSSETLLHLEVYTQLPEVKAVIHSHCKKITGSSLLESIRTKRFIPYGTMELADTAIQILRENKAMILKYHGEVIVGSSFPQALESLKQLGEKVR